MENNGRNSVAAERTIVDLLQKRVIEAIAFYKELQNNISISHGELCGTAYTKRPVDPQGGG